MKRWLAVLGVLLAGALLLPQHAWSQGAIVNNGLQLQGTPLSITFNNGTNTGTLLPASLSGDPTWTLPAGGGTILVQGSAAGGDLTGTYPNPTVAKIQGNAVASGTLGGGDAGKVLLWNGSAWTGTALSGDIASVSGTGAVALANVLATPGTYGSATAVPVITVDAKGRITSVGTATISGTVPSGTSAGDMLVWDGSAWTAVALSGDIASVSGTGAVALANVLATPGTYGSATAVPVITVDAKGRITSVGTATISGTVPSGTSAGDMLVWDGSAWTAVALSGDIASVSGTGAVALANVLATPGTYGSATAVPVITVDAKGRITSVGTATISGTVPSGTSAGDMLVWDGSAWTAVALSGDIASVSGTGAVALANVLATPGTYGSATAVPVITVDAKGRITSVGTATISGTVPSGTSAGDMLVWDGSAWTAVALSGDIASVSGTGAVALANVLATPGTYGSATAVPVITVDAKGRITSVGTATISGTVPSGTSAGDMLVWDGSAWTAVALSGDIASVSGTGAVALANVLATPGTYGSATAVPVITVDAKGRITSVGTATISGTVPSGTSAGDMLVWDGSAWTAVALSGDIASVSGTGAVALANVLATPGTYGSATAVPVITVDAKGRITSVGTATISGTVPSGTSAGDMLVWDGSAWTAVALSGDIASVSGTGAVALANVLATPGTYGSATAVPVITVDAKGRITSVGTATISGTVPSGTSAGDMLVWDGSAWTAVALSGDIASVSGTGAVALANVLATPGTYGGQRRCR
jgi:hypothetical protein